MSTVLGLCVLLMLGGLGGAASQVQVYGKSVYGGPKSGDVGTQSSGGHLTRSPTKTAIHRSLDLAAFNLHVSPTASKISLPTIIRLYPPTAKPLHLHANMPLRFGRAKGPSLDSSTNPNMPLRFGRSGDPAHHQPANPNMPLRFGRDSDSAPDLSPFNHDAPRFGREGDSTSGNNPTLPQRFGRARLRLQLCPLCSGGEEVQETQRDGLYWSLLRTIHSY